jgi:hypothetical protein
MDIGTEPAYPLVSNAPAGVLRAAALNIGSRFRLRVKNEDYKGELHEMVRHKGQWYANRRELEQTLEDARYRAQNVPWRVPERMLQPPPPKRKRTMKRRWIV